MKITAKFRASRRLRYEVTKRIMSPEMSPKSFGTFEKQEKLTRKGFLAVDKPKMFDHITTKLYLLADVTGGCTTVPIRKGKYWLNLHDTRSKSPRNPHREQSS